MFWLLKRRKRNWNIEKSWNHKNNLPEKINQGISQHKLNPWIPWGPKLDEITIKKILKRRCCIWNQWKSRGSTLRQQVLPNGQWQAINGVANVTKDGPKPIHFASAASASKFFLPTSIDHVSILKAIYSRPIQVTNCWIKSDVVKGIGQWIVKWWEAEAGPGEDASTIQEVESSIKGVCFKLRELKYSKSKW